MYTRRRAEIEAKQMHERFKRNDQLIRQRPSYFSEDIPMGFILLVLFEVVGLGLIEFFFH